MDGRFESLVSAGPRDWFIEPRVRDLRHPQFVEGLAIARAIGAARERLSASGQAVRWRDVLVLSRRRTHFARYEQALRSVGIPVVSDRLGGLLDRLEVSDMLALLRWLWRPADDLALVQVLKSPLFGVDDAALAWLGRDRETSWWERVQRACAGSGHPPGTDAEPHGVASMDGSAPGATAALREAHARLARWQARAAHASAHALMDRAVAECDAYARYAAAVPPPQREVVRANLDALLALALDLGGGRFQGVPAFLDALRRMRRADEQDAPAEGVADDVDAVQLMTIHGAKGLEAEIVVLADANGAARPQGGWRPLVGWDPLERAPRHVSFVHSARRHPSRLAWLDDDARLARLEDWNLLYVALTRARSALIVSGVRNERAMPDNWYARLQPIALFDDAAAAHQTAAQTGTGPATHGPATKSAPARLAGQTDLVWRQYRPQPPAFRAREHLPAFEVRSSAATRHAPAHACAAGARGLATAGADPGADADAAIDAEARRAALNDALHRCFEARTCRAARPAGDRLDEAAGSLPDEQANGRMRAALACAPLDPGLREPALALAARLLALPALRGCFDGTAAAVCPLELFDAQGRLLRIDCWAEFADEDWIVDWAMPLDVFCCAPDGCEVARTADGADTACAADAASARLAERRAAMAAIAPHRRLRTVCVQPDAGSVAFDPDLDRRGARA